MIKSLIDDHEELLSSMNWSFLPPEKSKEPWPKTRHAVLLGSFIIVQYDWNCYLWYHCFFLFFFLHLSIWPCICVLCLQISDQRYKGFKCKNRWKCCIVDIAKKKKRRRKYDCNTLSGKHVFDLHSAWKDILRWNLSYERLIRSSLATLLWEAFHCICLVLNPYTDLYIPSHLSSGTGSCMYF